ncbi:Carbonic anhydrase or acetyltransferase, isoleucine patch superfamily [Haloechinothrix alba]|uniref:Carbonic anhydrase or acetyltransferase, isoleucine patch superfamily n=1 Tax=Haloechinothrix alba TaxID=664784 RepID=A0A238W625_9PSEU|nr:gamma carbonic anhydrase family protein [Haloechinothrix alba]SNR42025.1 Carbonic anhydrase or acetyltransferase, isoleucine patch superfamily [Haloechinothrix alba]
MHRISLDGTTPHVADGGWVAPGVYLIGAVEVAAEASVWYGCVLRADNDRIVLGRESNLQDGCMVHADPDRPVTIGSGVSVGHGAVLHGCTIEDDVLVGMGATVLNGARIGSGSIIAAGAVVLENTEVPANSLVAGVPGKVRRETSQDERDHISANARTYLRHKDTHSAAVG